MITLTLDTTLDLNQSPRSDEWLYLSTVLRIVKITETESRMVIVKDNRKLLFNEDRVPVLQDEKSFGDRWQ
jgi:hypothetical protein